MSVTGDISLQTSMLTATTFREQKVVALTLIPGCFYTCSLFALVQIGWWLDGLTVFPPCLVWCHTGKMSGKQKSINKKPQESCRPFNDHKSCGVVNNWDLTACFLPRSVTSFKTDKQNLHLLIIAAIIGGKDNRAKRHLWKHLKATSRNNVFLTSCRDDRAHTTTFSILSHPQWACSSFMGKGSNTPASQITEYT